MIDAQNLMGVGNLYQSTNRNQNCYPKKGAQNLMGPTQKSGGVGKSKALKLEE